MCQTNQSTKAVVVGDLGRPFAGKLLEVAPRPPTGSDVGELLRATPRRSWPTGSRAERVPMILGSKSTRPAQRSGYVAAKSTPIPVRVAARPEHRALGSGRVHDGPDVVHRGLERLHLADPIRETRPSLVEHQHSTGRREPLHVADQERLVPGREEVSGDAPHEDDVDGTGANDLIGDRDVATSRVGDVRRRSQNRVCCIAARSEGIRRITTAGSDRRAAGEFTPWCANSHLLTRGPGRNLARRGYSREIHGSRWKITTDGPHRPLVGRAEAAPRLISTRTAG